VRRLRPELSWRNNLLLHHDYAPSRTFSFTRELQHECCPHPPDLAPCDFSAFLWVKIPAFCHKLCDRGRIAGSAEHPHKTQLSGCV
jgi:hypothetical protein